MSEILDAVIIGSGPAGCTAAIYLGRAGLRPVVVSGTLTPGGQLINTTDVENYPGFDDGILGPDLMDRMTRQAQRFGADFVAADVTAVKRAETSPAEYHVMLSTGAALAAKTIIVATGSTYRTLGIPGEREYSGHGVSYCATCDGFFFKGKPIVVVGGGDSAFEEALFLTRFGSSVTLIHRRDTFRASPIMVERAQQNPTITLLTNSIVTEIHGTATPPQASSAPSLGLLHKGVLPQLSVPRVSVNGLAGGTGIQSIGNRSAQSSPVGVTSITVRHTQTGEEQRLDTNAVFIAVGSSPVTEFLGDLVSKDDQGYVRTEAPSTRTSAPGIFAAGDCADPTYRQAISAAGTGCRAALDAQAYLLNH